MQPTLPLFGVLVCLGLGGCASTARKTWIAPDRSTELRFVPGPSGAQRSYSYYSLHDRRSGQRLAVARSIITDEAFQHSLPHQAVHFSPSGRTVLINEDVSDASPDYAYTLLYRDGSGVESRNLQLPHRSRGPEDFYGSWPFVVSITDSDVEYRFHESKTTERKRFDDLRDEGL